MIKFSKPSKKTTKILSVLLAGLNIVFALAWLFRVDLLLPALTEQLGNNTLAITLLVASILTAIFSIPFLFGVVKKSKGLRFFSGIAAILPAWIWTGIAIWTLGGVGDLPFVGPAIQFTTYAPFGANWMVLTFDILWLLFGIYVIKQLGVGEIYQLSSKAKQRAVK